MKQSPRRAATAAMLAAALCAGLAAAVPSATALATAGTSPHPARPDRAQLRTDAISAAIAAGASDRQLRRRFGLVREQTGGRPTAGAATRTDEAAARTVPVARAAGCGQVLRVGGSPTYMKVGTPRFYRNTGTSGPPYFVSATFSWDKGDRLLWSGWSCTGTVGGRDGFGLSISREVIRRSQSLALCAYGQCRTGRGSAVLADNNTHGAAYTYLDQATSLGENWTSGSLTVGFKYEYPHKCHQAFAKYAHTWSSTKVTGFGVGPYSFSISWSSSSHRWAVAGSGGRDSHC